MIEHWEGWEIKGQRLTLVNEDHDKFYEIYALANMELKDYRLLTRFGPRNTQGNGSKDVASFSSLYELARTAQKKLKEKLRKGYRNDDHFATLSPREIAQAAGINARVITKYADNDYIAALREAPQTLNRLVVAGSQRELGDITVQLATARAQRAVIQEFIDAMDGQIEFAEAQRAQALQEI